MRVGSTFSGVGGLDLGLDRAGHSLAFQVESDPYRRAVLARHWPDVPRYDDVATFDGREWRGRIDVLCGGFPCQDLSVAGGRVGGRQGLAGKRSSLWWEFLRIADDAIGSGGYVLVENVPGLLSSHGGRDFAIILAGLAEVGFCDVAWRVLDSRFFGVPQRRRRVFILGRRGWGDRCATVLLESEGGGGDFEAGRTPQARTTWRPDGGVARTRTGSGKRYDADTDDFIVALDRRGGGADDNEAQGRQLVVGATPDANGMRTPPRVPGRLDDPRPDGRRFAAIGDAVTVPVAEWIGRRLTEFHDTGPTRGRQTSSQAQAWTSR